MSSTQSTGKQEVSKTDIWAPLIKLNDNVPFDWEEFKEHWLKATYENHNPLQSISDTNN